MTDPAILAAHLADLRAAKSRSEKLRASLKRWHRRTFPAAGHDTASLDCRIDNLRCIIQAIERRRR